ncbi:MAG: SpoIIE family protein phosphatase [Phycisphaerales bacterium]|nr:SpoIIE family protein phosphatase [Phycisphaerales bacterium]
MRLLIRDGNDLIDTKVFADQPVVIGAGEDCDVKLPDLRLPSRLAVLKPDGDANWLLEPAHDGVPLTVNGRSVRQPTAITHNDEIGIQGFTIAVYRSQGEKQENGHARTVVSQEVADLRAHPLPAGSKSRTVRDELHVPGGAPVYLLELIEALAGCMDVPRLIDRLLEELFTRFGARRAFAGVRRSELAALEFVQCRTADGRRADDPPHLDSYVYRCLERDHFILVPAELKTGLGSAVVAPLMCHGRALGMLIAERKPDADPFERTDLDRLAIVAAVAADRLEKLLTQQEQVQRAATAGELAFVRNIQARMDPAVVPQWPGVQVAVYCKPGRERAGDVYDLLRLPNGLGMVFLGGISGETTRAAVAMAEVRSAFRMAALHVDAPHAFMRGVNWLLCDDRMRCELNAAAAAMNPLTGELQYCSAGAVGALIVDARGDSRDLTNHEAPAVGKTPGHPFEAGTDRLLPGETLALFTNGCCTVRNAAGRMLGHDGMVENIRDGFGQMASVALDELVRDHAAYFRDGRQPDDITILLFHRMARETGM